MLKLTVEVQSIVCDNLQSMMSTQVKAHDNLLETVSVMADIHHATKTTPAFTGRSKNDMTGASRECTVSSDST